MSTAKNKSKLAEHFAGEGKKVLDKARAQAEQRDEAENALPKLATAASAAKANLEAVEGTARNFTSAEFDVADLVTARASHEVAEMRVNACERQLDVLSEAERPQDPRVARYIARTIGEYLGVPYVDTIASGRHHTRLEGFPPVFLVVSAEKCRTTAEGLAFGHVWVYYVRDRIHSPLSTRFVIDILTEAGVKFEYPSNTAMTPSESAMKVGDGVDYGRWRIGATPLDAEGNVTDADMSPEEIAEAGHRAEQRDLLAEQAEKERRSEKQMASMTPEALEMLTRLDGKR